MVRCETLCSSRAISPLACVRNLLNEKASIRPLFFIYRIIPFRSFSFCTEYRMLQRSLRRLFSVAPGEEIQCLVLRNFPAEWVREDCTSFIERCCEVRVAEAHMPPDLHSNRSFHACFLKFQSPADAQHVYAMAQQKWVPPNDNFEKETYEFSTSKYTKIFVDPYRHRVQRPSLYEDALLNVMNMDVDRFLMNPDVLSDIEMAHNPKYRFANAKRKKL